jgi:sarcosine oxidase
MIPSTDVIVIGLGAMGSAIAGNLAARGLRVAAFDRFTPPHVQGSSHGRSRIFRQAYFEDPRYVHLLLRARELWEKLEHESGRKLLHVTGALMIAPQDGQLVKRSAESAGQFSLPHEILAAAEIKRRWPVFRTHEHTEALLEHDAGFLIPEQCIEAQLALAARAGAKLHFDEPVLEWSHSAGGVTVRTARGGYSAGHLVIAAGPWAPQVLAEMGWPMRVTRQVIFWFEPKENLNAYRRGRLPIYLIETESDKPIVYGFPLTGPDNEGLKVGVHGSNEVCTPENVCREIRPEDEQAIRRALAETLPSLADRLVRAETCLYTMTPDENFILGLHPKYPEVTLAAGFSGHGFKFAPVIGEIVGELVSSGRSRFDIEMFSPLRFASAMGASPARASRRN